jgi:hypothetical protein
MHSDWKHASDLVISQHSREGLVCIITHFTDVKHWRARIDVRHLTSHGCDADINGNPSGDLLYSSESHPNLIESHRAEDDLQSAAQIHLEME